MQIYSIFKKQLTDFSEICSVIPCFLISATNSGKLHWLTLSGSSGLLQARPIIRKIWFGVKTDGHRDGFYRTGMFVFYLQAF